MKWIGFLLAITACAGTGQWAASQLSRRVRRLQGYLSLIESIKTQLAFTMAEPAVILQQVQENSAFQDFSFLPACIRHCRQGDPFPLAWQKSLEQTKAEYRQPEDQRILWEIGEVLGSTSMEGQISQLNLLQDRLRQQLETALAKCQTSGKLYRSLGLLGGLALVIVLW